MNCDEVAAALDTKYFIDRDPRSDCCRSPARRGMSVVCETPRTARGRGALDGVTRREPSAAILENVMSQIANRACSRFASAQGRSYEILDTRRFLPVLCYCRQHPWSLHPVRRLPNLWSTPGIFRAFGMWAYLGQHPAWALPVAGFATLLIVFGLTIPERPLREPLTRAVTVARRRSDHSTFRG